VLRGVGFDLGAIERDMAEFDQPGRLAQMQDLTLLIDEGDNLGLAANGPLRAVLNSGHRKGGKVTRFCAGQARSFSTFVPAAVAAIGTLQLPFMHRSIVIPMVRHDGRDELKRLDKDDPDTKADLNIAYRMIFTWASRHPYGS
jgi:hypothetical protein